MSKFDEHALPEDLNEIDKRLRDAQPTFSAVELDQLKQRTLARASSRTRSTSPRRFRVKSRLLTFGLAATLLGATAAGGIASTSGGGSSGSAAVAQYAPPAFCSNDPYPFPYLAPPGYASVKCAPFTNPYNWCPGHWSGLTWVPGYWWIGSTNPGHGFPGPSYPPLGTFPPFL
jgi:hypothetical protein